MDKSEEKLDKKNLLEKRAPIFEDQSPIELSYDIKITAKIKNQQDKVILSQQKGIIPA